MIKAVDVFAAVAVTAHVGVDMVDSVLVTNAVDAVVAVAVAVVVHMLNGHWCFLSCPWCLHHWRSLSRLRPHATLKRLAPPVLLDLPVPPVLPNVVVARCVLVPWLWST